MKDLHGNEIDSEMFVVTFLHADGIGTAIFGAHDIITDPAVIDGLIRNIRRAAYVDPVVIDWTDRTGTHRPGPVVRSSTSPVANTDDPLTDVGGYLACGCHGSQREHTCIPND